MRFFNRRSHQQGFTLIEMLVVSPIVILAIGAFLTVIISMTGEVIASRASNSLAYNVQDTLNRIEQDIKLSSGFLAQNNVLGQDQGYNNDATNFTNIAGASGTSLILNMVATTDNPVSINNGYVFLRDKPNDCATPQGNIPFTYNVVYFIKDDTLFRRTIMPANYNDTVNTVCSIPWQQPSCAPSYMDAPSSTFCKTRDIQLVTGVKPGDFALQYFNGEAATGVNTPASSAPAVADRNTALQSATTVGVTINAEQSAGGRTVERSAILRASRLDSNASAIAVLSADTAPPAPQVSSTTGEPTSVTFTWGKLATAASYTFEYQINGGGWTTGFSNQPTRTFTVTTATHKDVVNARVTATNSIGNSGYGTASVTIPLWTPFNLQNNWVNYAPPYATAAYTKTSAGVILLKGLIRSGTTTGGTVIMNLPVGYRPDGWLLYAVTGSTSVGRIAITPNGDVVSYGGVGANASYTSLDGMSFIPSGSPYTLTALSLANSWINFGSDFSDLVSTIDSAGRVNVQGSLKNGSTTASSHMANLPSGSVLPASDFIYFPVPNGGGTFGFTIVNPSGGIQYQSGGNSIQGLNFRFYPSSRANGPDCTVNWCTLPLSSGWVAFDSARTPVYTKGSDGIVSVNGLGKSGTTTANTVLGTLPVGYRPSENLVITSVCASAYCRLDVLPDGTIRARTGVSSGWSSFDSIQFMAEQ